MCTRARERGRLGSIRLGRISSWGLALLRGIACARERTDALHSSCCSIAQRAHARRRTPTTKAIGVNPSIHEPAGYTSRARKPPQRRQLTHERSRSRPLARERVSGREGERENRFAKVPTKGSFKAAPYAATTLHSRSESMVKLHVGAHRGKEAESHKTDWQNHGILFDETKVCLQGAKQRPQAIL
jgi:hypothetical protein